MRLVFAPKAQKSLRTVPDRDRTALMRKLEQFAEAPYTAWPWAKTFEANRGRIRHGVWRALYRIEHEQVTVFIVRIDHRREVYR